MRPVLRGESPRPKDFENYRDAFGDLVSRLGMFCSYCERRIATQLAVEHIQPKALAAYQGLEGRWDNFLLACVNCNSTKGDRDVVLKDVLLPDRDNTAAAYRYTRDGEIEIQPTLTPAQRGMAESTLNLIGLNKPIRETFDSNDRLVAIDRMSQRKEAWFIALSAREDWRSSPSDSLGRTILHLALAQGFFSIWMAVFEDEPSIRRLLIRDFAGTASDCFDLDTTKIVSPRPSNGLADGSKL